MHLILHLIWKDWRQARYHLAAWLAGMAGTALMFAWSRSSLGPTLTGPNPWVMAGVLVVFITAFLGYNVFVELILADSPANSSAFWITRPIAPWRLLAAKLISAAVIAALGASAFTAVLAVTGMIRPAAAGQNFLMLFASCASLGVLAFAIAPLSRTTRQCLLFSLLAYGIFAVGAVGFQSSSLGKTAAFAPYDVIYARVALGWRVALVGVAALILHQYLTRRTARSLTFAALGSVATLWIVTASRVTWPQPTLAAEENADAYRDVGIAVTDVIPSAATRKNQKELQIVLRVSGAPAQISATPLVSSHRWTDEATGESFSTYFRNSVSVGRSPEKALMLHPGQGAESFNVSVHGILPSRDLREKISKRVPLSYAAEIPLEILTQEIEHEVPFALGKYGEKRGSDLTITAIERKPTEVRVAMTINHVDGIAESEPIFHFFAVNRRLGTHRAPSSWGYSTMAFSSTRATQVVFYVDPKDADFWNDAVLAQVGVRKAGVVRRKVELTQFLATKEEKGGP